MQRSEMNHILSIYTLIINLFLFIIIIIIIFIITYYIKGIKKKKKNIIKMYRFIIKFLYLIFITLFNLIEYEGRVAFPQIAFRQIAFPQVAIRQVAF